MATRPETYPRQKAVTIVNDEQKGHRIKIGVLINGDFREAQIHLSVKELGTLQKAIVMHMKLGNSSTLIVLGGTVNLNKTSNTIQIYEETGPLMTSQTMHVVMDKASPNGDSSQYAMWGSVPNGSYDDGVHYRKK